MRDEKKRKKNSSPEDPNKSFFILCLTNKCLRVIKLVLKPAGKQDISEKSYPVDTRPRMANSLIQTLKNSEESYTIFIATVQGKIEMHNMQMNLIIY